MRQPAEHAQFDDRHTAPVELREPLQRLVDREQFRRALAVGRGKVVEGDAFDAILASAALGPAAGARAASTLSRRLTSLFASVPKVRGFSP